MRSYKKFTTEEYFLFASFGVIFVLLSMILGCGASDGPNVRTPEYFIASLAAAEQSAMPRVVVKPVVDNAPPAAKPLPEIEYQEARRRFNEEKKPLLIVLHASWCQPCHQLIDRTLPRVGNLDAVSLTLVDVDADPELCAKLSSSKSIPQMILFYYDNKQEACKKVVVGAKSAEQIEEMIDDATHLPDVR